MGLGWDYELYEVNKLLDSLYWKDLHIGIQTEGSPKHEDTSRCLVHTHNGNWLGWVSGETVETLMASGQVYWENGNMRYRYTDERPEPTEYLQMELVQCVYYHLPGEYNSRYAPFETDKELDAILRENPGIPHFKFAAGYYWGNYIWTEGDGLIKDQAELPSNPSLFERLPWHRSYKPA